MSPGRRRSLARCEDTCSLLPTHHPTPAPVLSPWPCPAQQVPDADACASPGPTWSRQPGLTRTPACSAGLANTGTECGLQRRVHLAACPWEPFSLLKPGQPPALRRGATSGAQRHASSCQASGHQLNHRNWTAASTPLTPPTCAFYGYMASVLDTPKWNLPNECLSAAGGAGGLAAWPPPLCGPEHQPSPGPPG